MTTTTLLSEISRLETYPKFVDVTATDCKGFVNVTVNNWTSQQFYELPVIKFDIYTKVNTKNTKLLVNSFNIKTYYENLQAYESQNISRIIKNIPEASIIAITPIFDNNIVSARNMLIENGIESGDIWNTTYDTFDISISFTA